MIKFIITLLFKIIFLVSFSKSLSFTKDIDLSENWNEDNGSEYRKNEIYDSKAPMIIYSPDSNRKIKRSPECKNDSECEPFEDCVEETCQIPNPELHSCCKTLGVHIECWGICMGDCSKSQEVDPILLMTSCGRFLHDVAEKCCANGKTTDSRTIDNGKKSDKIRLPNTIKSLVYQNTKDIKSETQEDEKSISNDLSTVQPSVATFEKGRIGLTAGSTKCQNKESYCNAVHPDCSITKVKRDCKKYCGLCQSSKCANEESWCDFARPNCSTTLAQKNCKKFCGLCGGRKTSMLNYFTRSTLFTRVPTHILDSTQRSGNPAGRDCPPKCKKCRPGKPPNGKDLDENRNCHFFCSRWNECGNSPNHEAGQDCRSCSFKTSVSTESKKVTLVSKIDSKSTDKIYDKVFVKRKFDSVSPTDPTLEEEKNPIRDCCKVKDVPKYCLGFCSIRLAGERSMNVGLGKCKEHTDTIKMCKTSKSGHRMLMLPKEKPQNEQMSVTSKIPLLTQSNAQPRQKSKRSTERYPELKITTENVLISTTTVQCKNESKPEFAFLRTQLHSKYIKKCCEENLPNNCMKQCQAIDNIDYVSDCSCQQYFKEDAEFMKCIKNREPDCSCTDFVNPSGIGYCKKTYTCANLEDPRCVKKFHEKYVCYVNQPTNCEDVTNSQFSKGKKASAAACEKEEA